jgi:nitroimidazol reductase NimA-like FMN-containing flavoprotein (pyridoxamine 5'-phosphate oxidase superfamily)
MDQHRWLAQLTRTTALDLLGSVPIGRLVFTRQTIPSIRPVNHLVEGESIIVRVSAGAAITAAAGEGRSGVVVAYEADSLDPQTRLGWSVVVTGTARLLSDERGAARYRSRLESWLTGTRDDVIVITADVVTGYQLVAVEPTGRDRLASGAVRPAVGVSRAGPGIGRLGTMSR